MEETKTGTATTATAPRNSKLALWSMILGIAGLILSVICIGYLMVLIAIIFGIVALVQISGSKGLLLGKGKAIAGLILGGAAIVLIPFVAIVAAIAIPNLLSGRMAANESSAVAGLKLFCSAEAVWLQQDADGNGKKDYWTYDVSCLHRMYRSDNQTKVAFIPIDMARADQKPAVLDQSVRTFGFEPLIENWANVTLSPKSGYFFRAMEQDENGLAYNQNEVGNTEYKAANNSKFAFVAYPAEYGTSGVRIFIINQEGTIYSTDPGSDAGKIVLQWPGPNPSAETGPGGRPWSWAD